MTATYAEVRDPGRTDDVVLAERTVLGSMVAYRDAAERLLETLDRDDCFSEGIHRAIYAAVRYLTEEGSVRYFGDLPGHAGSKDETMDGRFSAVLHRLVTTEHGIWKTGQAGATLGGFMRYATPAFAAAAATVLRAARQRWLLSALETAQSAASRPGFDAAEEGDLVRGVIDDALMTGPEVKTTVTAADLFLSTVQRLEAGRPPGLIQLPWKHLRDLIPWLRAGQLVSVLARPSFGKSLFGQDLARDVGIRQQIPAALFTVEMDRDEVMDRLIAAESGVTLDRIINCDLDDEAWERIAAAKERFEASKLAIDDSPKLTLSHIRAVLRGMARTEPAKLAIVDYLQLMSSPPGAASREQEVAGNVGGLKRIAREFRLPVVMLGQLNRGPEARQDKKPYLSDARESGSIENDSDVAILIHRPDMYDPESERAGEADLIVAKNRNGPRGTATVGFQGHRARLVDLAPAGWTPPSGRQEPAGRAASPPPAQTSPPATPDANGQGGSWTPSRHAVA